MTTIPSITPLPTPVPTTADPADFDARADDFLAALPDLVTEENAAIAAINTVAGEVTASAAAAATSAGDAADEATAAALAAAAAVGATGYTASSATSLSIGTGSKAFTTQAGKSFAASGDRVTAISRSTPSARMRGAATYSGTALTITVDAVEGSGTYADWILVATSLEAGAVLGRQAIWIPASAMIPRTTSGAAYGSTESATNKVNVRTLDFDASAVENVQFAVRLPKSWNEGTVSFVPLWSHAAAATNFGVTLELQAVAIGDGDLIDAAFGAAASSTDTGGVTDKLYVGPESGAITIAGTPQPEDWVVFQIRRAVADAGDTLAVDARLHGLTLYITTDVGTDA